MRVPTYVVYEPFANLPCIRSTPTTILSTYMALVCVCEPPVKFHNLFVECCANIFAKYGMYVYTYNNNIIHN